MTKFYKHRYSRQEVHLVSSAYKRQDIPLWPKSTLKKFVYYINGVTVDYISNLGNFKYLILLKSGVCIVLNDTDHLALKDSIRLEYKNQHFFHFSNTINNPPTWEIFSDHGRMI